MAGPHASFITRLSFSAVAGMLWLSASLTGAARSAPATERTLQQASPLSKDSAYGRLAASFVENRGQAPPSVRYLRAAGATPLFFSEDGVRFWVESGGRRTPLSIRFMGADTDVEVLPEEASGGVVNYLLGGDPRRWKSGLPSYGAIRYANVWPGIDVVFRGDAASLKYEFVVRPGADPSRVRLSYQGVASMRLAASGDLELATGRGVVIDKAPTTYQVIGGKRISIDSSFALHDGTEYGFRLAAYDTAHTLVIDPTIAYSSFIGGSAADRSDGIAIDQSGSAYVAGTTGSNDFPVTPEAYDTSFAGGGPSLPTDAFVAKLNPAGTAFAYVTYLGGSANDEALGIAVDHAGNAYVTGRTHSDDFPATAGAFQTSIGAGRPDAFVTKLDSTGASLVYSTFVGANASTSGVAIAVDFAGAAHVTGDTLATNLAITAGAIQQSRTSSGQPDGFLVKLDPSGSSVSYGTHIGGDERDWGRGIAVDPAGYTYITGRTASIDLRTSDDAVQPAPSSAAFKSVDAGVTFTPVTGGLRVKRVTALALDPHNPAIVYAGTEDAGLFVSADGGGSWTAINTGLLSPYAAINDIAVNPSAVTTLLAASSAGIYKSTDSGRTWQRVSMTPATRIGYAPANPQVVYAAGIAGGLKSSDGGESWSVVLSFPATALAVHPWDAEVVYFGTQTASVVKSVDGGANWVAASNGLPSYSLEITALALDPGSPDVLYTAVRNTTLFKTSSGGASWSFILTSASDVTRITFDPVDSSVIYATGRAFVKTTDSGATWQLFTIRGLFLGLDAFAVHGAAVFTGTRVADEGFAYKIATDGRTDALVFGTYIGGSGTDWGEAIAVESNGNSVIAVNTTSADLPVTVAAERRFEAAIVKLNSTGSAYIYAAPLATANYTIVDAVAVDPNGVAYAAGGSDDTARYIWIERVDPTGLVSARVTLQGGGFLSGDWPGGIAVDGAANVYLSALTGGMNFPTSPSAAQQNFGGGRSDAVVTKLSFADVGAVNLAAGRPAVASSVESGEYAAENAADANPSTRWSSQFSDPQWIYVDLGARYHVDRLVLHWEIAFARFYEIQISDDAEHWIPVASSGGSSTRESDGGTDNLPNLDATGRYVRIYGTARATPWGYSLWEMEVYGTPEEGPPPPVGSINLALNRLAWASSSENGNSDYLPIRAVDGQAQTRWSSEFSDPQWIVIDLGQPIDITRVVLRWETAYGSDYRIDVSNDATNWTTIRTVMNGDGDIDDLTGLSASARYVRMHGSRRGTEWGYSLWEFEVYGSVAQAPVEVVLYASDVPDRDLHGWFTAADALSPNGIKLVTSDAGWSSKDEPPPWLDNPEVKWVDFRFIAPQSGTYKIWLRLKATGDVNSNDSVWVQFSAATVDGAPAYYWGTQDALLVNLEDCYACGVSGWGWQSSAWWLEQPTIVALPTGPQTLRVMVREDGVQLDQVVLSPVAYRDTSPGSVTDDTTVVGR